LGQGVHLPLIFQPPKLFYPAFYEGFLRLLLDVVLTVLRKCIARNCCRICLMLSPAVVVAVLVPGDCRVPAYCFCGSLMSQYSQCRLPVLLACFTGIRRFGARAVVWC